MENIRYIYEILVYENIRYCIDCEITRKAVRITVHELAMSVLHARKI